MNMDNNLENKAKFFAQYFGQKVRVWEKMPKCLCYVFASALREEAIKESHLQLKPLSEISDEDKTYLGVDWASSFNEYGYAINLWSAQEVDYLRSKRYLLPFNGLSCEELLNRGWAVLEQKATNG